MKHKLISAAVAAVAGLVVVRKAKASQSSDALTKAINS